MTAFLITNTKIMTGATPLFSVRENPFAPGPELGQQMRELMQKGAANLFITMAAQQRV
jgi:hypothetical protein